MTKWWSVAHATATATTALTETVDSISAGHADSATPEELRLSPLPTPLADAAEATLAATRTAAATAKAVSGDTERAHEVYRTEKATGGWGLQDALSAVHRCDTGDGLPSSPSLLLPRLLLE